MERSFPTGGIGLAEWNSRAGNGLYFKQHCADGKRRAYRVGTPWQAQYSTGWGGGFTYKATGISARRALRHEHGS